MTNRDSHHDAIMLVLSSQLFIYPKCRLLFFFIHMAEVKENYYLIQKREIDTSLKFCIS